MKINENNISSGVVHTNNVMWLWEKAFNNGINISFENYMRECPDNVDKEEWADSYYPDEETYYIGVKKASIYEHEEKIMYDIDEKAEYTAIVGPMYTQILKSKYVSYAHHCSPCFPDQNDLGTKGGNPTYALPANLYNDEFDTHLEIYELDT